MTYSSHTRSAQEFPAPREDPLIYPGSRPESSYVLADGIVWPITKCSTGNIQGSILNAKVQRFNDTDSQSINDFLQSKSAAPLEERFPVLGYGSNPVPGQLISKFGQKAVVPVAYGSLPKADVVYNLISNKGYAFAEILFDDENTEIRIAVSFLDEKQLKIMIDTEQNYHLSFSPVSVTLELGDVIPGGLNGLCYIFAGFRKIWVPKTYIGPVPIAELPSKGRTRPPLTQEQILNLVVKEFGLNTRGIKTARDLSDQLREEETFEEKPGKLKYELQQAVENDPRSLPPAAGSVILVPHARLPEKTFTGSLA
jgi:hypothetical protein